MNDYDAPTLDEVNRALDFVSPISDRDDWVLIAMALKNEFGDLGFDLFDSWSQGSDQYKVKNCRDTWKSVKSSGSTTILTLFQRAKEGGFSPEKKELSIEDKKARVKEAEKRRVASEARAAVDEAHELRWRSVVAQAAFDVWQRCVGEGKSDYLLKKKVRSFGLRFPAAAMVLELVESEYRYVVHSGKLDIDAFYSRKVEDTKFRHIKPGVCVVPLVDDENSIHNIQLIYTQNKSFLPGRVSGLMHVLAFPQSDDQPIVVGEGYATVASCHMATQWPVFMALHSGNLGKVVASIRRRYPNNRIIIAADDDHLTDGNPGKTKAIKSANDSGACVVLPVFKEVACAA